MANKVNFNVFTSGIDFNSIIDALVSLEAQKLTDLTEKQKLYTDQKIELQNLNSMLTSFRLDLFDLTLNKTFSSFKATSSNEDIASASIDSSTPVLGSFTVEVNQLATPTKVESSTQIGGTIDPTAVIATQKYRDKITAGTFTINGVEISIDPNTDTLNDVIDKINNSGAGVIASYDDTTDKITLKNATTGDSARIVVGASTDTSNFLEVTGLLGAYQQLDSDDTNYVEGMYHLGAINPKEELADTNFATAITEGEIKINGVSIFINPYTDTLEDVLSKINNSEAGVRAWYDPVKDAVVMESTVPGAYEINFEEVSSNFLTATNIIGATQELGQNAQITINGSTVLYSNTNEFEYGGVKINVNQTGTTTITVDRDIDKAVDAVKKMVDGYNEIIEKIYKLYKDKDSPLHNDNTIMMIADNINRLIFDRVAVGIGISSADQIGLSTSKIDVGSTDWQEGTYIPKIELDESKLREALRNNPDQVYEFFNLQDGDLTTQQGVAIRLRDYLQGLTDAGTGVLTQRIKYADEALEDVAIKIDDFQKHLDEYRESLILKYSAVDSQLSDLNSQLNWLQAQFASLQTSTKK